jgi:hypothetical protein
MKQPDIEEALRSVIDKLSDYEKRLQTVEDQLEIQNLMTRYGLAADCGNDELAMACHTEHAQYRVSAPQAGREGEYEDLVLKGREAIGTMLRSKLHQSMLPNTAHTVGPSDVLVNGDSAQAVGYSRLYLREEDQPRLMRLAINQWLFERVCGQWLIARRDSRLVGEEAAQKILQSIV